MISLATPIIISAQERKLGLGFLLVYTFVMIVGFSMLMPLVAVHFVNNLGMTATIVGLALAVRQLTQQGLTIAGGILADRIGIRPMISAGVILRALGFASLAWADNHFLLFLALIISALGGAFFEAPYQASIAALTTDANRSHYYLISNVVGSIASALGPLIGVILLAFNFQIVCLVAAGCFLVNFFIALFFLPKIEQPVQDEKSTSGMGLVLGDKRFVFFTGIMAGYWFTSVQFNLSFPLWAEKLSGTQTSVGIMYAICAVITIALQYHMVKLFERWFDTRQILIAGIITISLACTAIGFVSQFSTFLICVVFFQLGILLTRPTQQIIIASLANKQALATYMGFSSLALAVGGGLGNLLGGVLLDTANNYQIPSLPWIVFGGIGLLTAAAIFLTVRLPDKHFP